jgi:hypothetical protein
MHNKNHPEASVHRSLAAPVQNNAARPSPHLPPVIKIPYGGNERVKFSDTCVKRRKFRTVLVDNAKALQRTRHPKNVIRMSNEPSTAGGRELRLKARPPAGFSSLRSPRIVNQKQEPACNTLLAQRYPSSGNSYFWRTMLEEIESFRHVNDIRGFERELFPLLPLQDPFQVQCIMVGSAAVGSQNAYGFEVSLGVVKSPRFHDCLERG